MCIVTSSSDRDSAPEIDHILEFQIPDVKNKCCYFEYFLFLSSKKENTCLEYILPAKHKRVSRLNNLNDPPKNKFDEVDPSFYGKTNTLDQILYSANSKKMMIGISAGIHDTDAQSLLIKEESYWGDDTTKAPYKLLVSEKGQDNNLRNPKVVSDYSVYEIPNIPEGKHVIRLASQIPDWSPKKSQTGELYFTSHGPATIVRDLRNINRYKQYSEEAISDRLNSLVENAVFPTTYNMLVFLPSGDYRHRVETGRVDREGIDRLQRYGLISLLSTRPSVPFAVTFTASACGAVSDEDESGHLSCLGRPSGKHSNLQTA